MSLAVAILAVLGWMALDLGVGITMALMMAVAWYAAEALAGALGSAQTVWIAFIALFVAGWVLQFLGHHYEGKRPALLDNIFRPSSAQCSWSPRPWSSWAGAAISPRPWAKATSRHGEQG
jgi:uncharacterized membrane protein YGL010W